MQANAAREQLNEHVASTTEVGLPPALSDIEVRVAARPLSGISLSGDCWMVSLDEIGVDNIDVGFDAALCGLTPVVSRRVAELLTEPGAERDQLFPLLVRLWLAERSGELSSVLRRAMFVDHDFD
jgi:hypothetical protein